MTDLNAGLPDPPTCPLLGLVADQATHFSFPHAGHRCGATRSPSVIDLPHQSRYCLAADFEACDRYAEWAGRHAADAKPQPLAAAAADEQAAPPTATVSGTVAPSATTLVAAVPPAAPANSLAAPANQAPSAPAPRTPWALYPPDPDSPGPVPARAPGTWRETSIDTDAGGPAAPKPAGRTSTARRVLRGVAVVVVLLLVLFVAAFVVAGSRLGLNGGGHPSSSVATVIAPAAATGLGASPAVSVSAPGASSTPAQSAGASPSPRPSPSESPTPTPSPRTKSTIHVVRPGETLQGIAAEYGVTVERLVVANKLPDPNVIVTGQRLVIPAPSRAP